MNSLNILYFPGTDIYSIRQYPIFLLFQKIHLIKPIEADPAESGKESSDSFIKSGFCQVHTPCPLGQDRDRFNHLVADIKNRKDDYAAQLSALILAAGSGAAGIDPDSEQAIMRSLRPAQDQQEKAARAEKEDKLWQARLILAIGEILDEEEEDIARNLALLDDEQAELFKQLHGDNDPIDEDTPFAELIQVERKLGAGNSGNIKKRFNGWKTLFLEGNIQECEVFLTTSRDSGDLLLELYEKKTNLSAPLVAGLKLPGLVGRNCMEASQSVGKFRQQNRDLLSLIHQYFAELAHKKTCSQQETTDNKSFAALSQQWETQIETVFPAQQFGRIPVNCYLFPGLACATLIGGNPPRIAKAENGLLVVVG